MPRILEWPMNEPLPDEFLSELGALLNGGGVCVYPTSTLYGLGASAHSARGIALLNDIKKRPPGMPVSIMATAAQIDDMCEIPESARPFLDCSENRITAILPAMENAPAGLVHSGTLAVRLPCCPLTASLVEAAGPVTATSANIHGTPTPSDVPSVIGQFGEKVCAYIDSGLLAGKPTTFVDFTAKAPKIIREGALSREELERFHER